MTSIDDYLRALPQAKGAKAGSPDLYAMANLRAVLDALPNSREELEALVERAEEAVAGLDARIRDEHLLLADEFKQQLADARDALASAAADAKDAAIRSASQQAQRVADRVQTVESAASELRLKVGQVEAGLRNITFPVERSDLDRVQRDVADQVARVGTAVTDTQQALEQRIKDLQSEFDERIAKLRKSVTKTAAIGPGVGGGGGGAADPSAIATAVDSAIEALDLDGTYVSMSRLGTTLGSSTWDGSEVDVSFFSPWGIDSNDDPYYDPDGAAPGEEAVLVVDRTGALIIVKPDPGLDPPSDTVDGPAGTGTLRTLGTGAQQAAAGNDARFTDAREPTAHAETHHANGDDPITPASIDAAPSAHTHEQEAPLDHATSHLPGGGDELYAMMGMGQWDGTFLETTPRMLSSGTVTLANGTMLVTHFTAMLDKTVTTLQFYCVTAATFGGGALFRLGLCSVASNGDLTLLAATASDLTLIQSNGGTNTKAFDGVTGTSPGSVAMVRGNRYAIVVLATGMSSAGSIRGVALGAAGMTARAPRMAGSVAGQTDLPSSVVSASISNNANVLHVELS